jgi:hypothetical protein
MLDQRRCDADVEEDRGERQVDGGLPDDAEVLGSEQPGQDDGEPDPRRLLEDEADEAPADAGRHRGPSDRDVVDVPRLAHRIGHRTGRFERLFVVPVRSHDRAPSTCLFASRVPQPGIFGTNMAALGSKPAGYLPLCAETWVGRPFVVAVVVAVRSARYGFPMMSFPLPHGERAVVAPARRGGCG